MNVSMLFCGEYPGYGAAANRLMHYEIGLRAAGCHVMTESIPSNRKRYNHLYRLIIPILAFKRTLSIRNSSDIVLVYGFGWCSIILICLGAFFSGAKVILEINEKPGTCYTNWFSEIKPFKVFNYVFLTRLAFPLLDGFIVISDALEQYISYHKSKHAAVIKVPILISKDRFNITKLPEIDVNKPFMLHAGALSDKKDGIINVIKAFAIVCNERGKEFHFYLTSKVAPKYLLDEIDAIIKFYNLEEHIHFLGNISHEELVAYQKECSLVVINKPLNQQNLYNFPTKVAECLAMGIPIIASDIGELGYFLTDNVNALLIKENNCDVIADKIQYVLNNPELILDILIHGKVTAVEKFDAISHGERLRLFFERL